MCAVRQKCDLDPFIPACWDHLNSGKEDRLSAYPCGCILDVAAAHFVLDHAVLKYSTGSFSALFICRQGSNVFRTSCKLWFFPTPMSGPSKELRVSFPACVQMFFWFNEVIKVKQLQQDVSRPYVWFNFLSVKFKCERLRTTRRLVQWQVGVTRTI